MQPSDPAAQPAPLPETLSEAPEGARMAQADDLVAIPTRGGGRQFLPVSAVAKLGGQLYGGQAMLSEASELRHEAGAHRALMSQLSNPATAPAALAGLTRIAERSGVDVNALIASLSTNAATPAGDPEHRQQVATSTSPQDPNTRELAERVRTLEAREQQADFNKSIDEVMKDWFPGVETETTKGKARFELARTQVLATQVSYAEGGVKKSLAECAREVQQQWVDGGLATSLQRTAVRDQRRDAAQNTPVNPNLGAAPTANAAKSDVGGAALDSGRFKQGMKDFLRQAHAALGPNPSAP